MAESQRPSSEPVRFHFESADEQRKVISSEPVAVKQEAAVGKESNASVAVTVSGANSADAAQPSWTRITKREKNLIMIALMNGQFLAALDQMIVVVALPTIAIDLGGLNLLSWVVSIYLLTTSAFMPLWGKFSDVWGRRPVYLVAVVLFVAGSIICAVAPDLNTLVGGRAVQGIGGGGLQSLALILIGDIVAPADRAKHMSVVATVWSLASVLGPVLGGLFTSYVTWRLIFWINLPFCAMCFVISFITMRKIQNAQRSLPIDIIGSLLVGGGTVCLVLFATWGGQSFGYPWGSGTIIGLIVASFGLFALFIVQEMHHGAPIFNLKLFRIRNFTAAAVTFFFFGISMFSVLTYLPLYFQDVRGDSPIISGLKQIPMVIGWQFSTINSGVYISRTGKYYWIPACGTALAVAAVGLLSLMDETMNYGIIFVLLLLQGLGFGSIMVPHNSVVQNSVPYADMASALSGVGFSRMIGGSIGVAVLGAVNNQALTNYYHAHGMSPGLCSQGFYDNLQCRSAFLHALQEMFLSTMAPCALTFVGTLFLSRSITIKKPGAPAATVVAPAKDGQASAQTNGTTGTAPAGGEATKPAADGTTATAIAVNGNGTANGHTPAATTTTNTATTTTGAPVQVSPDERLQEANGEGVEMAGMGEM